MKVQPANFTGHFLIAMPSMADPNFARTLTFVCEHNDGGALGVIVNRPTEMNWNELFERIDISLDVESLEGHPVYFGGPVQVDRGFVLHRPVGNWHSTLTVGDELGFTSSRDILEAVARDGQPEEMLISLGYAGWAAGQLEWEMSQNAWLSVGADPRIIFGLPVEQRLPAAMHLLGIDYANLSDVAGHG